MNHFLKITLLFLYWLCANIAHSQSDFTLDITTDSLGFSFEQQGIELHANHTDTVSVQQHLQAIVQQLQQKGFWETSLDYLSFQEKKVFAQLHIGSVYQNIHISLSLIHI